MRCLMLEHQLGAWAAAGMNLTPAGTLLGSRRLELRAEGASHLRQRWCPQHPCGPAHAMSRPHADQTPAVPGLFQAVAGMALTCTPCCGGCGGESTEAQKNLNPAQEVPPT